MKIQHKKYWLLAYSILCLLTLIGIILYRNFYELLHVGFIPYLLLAPGILYFIYRENSRTGSIAALGITIGLFILPLFAIWLDGRNAANILGGLLPYNDASAYYFDGLGLLENKLLSHISVRRPIFTAFLSFLFLITGRNLQLSLIILAVLNSGVCYLLARRIQKLWGTFPAVTVILLIFFFYRRFVGTTLTENLGLALGMMAFSLLLAGVQNADRKLVLLGIFLLSLGLNVRAGALLILPVCALWAGWFFRDRARFSASMFFLAVLAVALGFFVNWGTEKLVVDPDIGKSKTGMFSNYSYTFYGITSGGKGWNYFHVDHPEVAVSSNREAVIYEYAFQSIRQKPLLFLKGLSKSFLDFFSPINGAYSFLYASTSNPCLMEDFLTEISSCQVDLNPANKNTFISCAFSNLSSRTVDILFSLVTSLILLITLLWKVIVSIKKKENPYQILLITLLFGIIISAPLLPPRDASKMRVYAVTQPILITAGALGLAEMFRFLSRKLKFLAFFRLDNKKHLPSEKRSSRELVFTGSFLAILIIISPIAARLFAKTPVLKQGICPAHLQERSFRFNPGSSITIVDDATITIDWTGLRIPAHHFESNLDEFCIPSDQEAPRIAELGLLQPGEVLIEPAFQNQGRALSLFVISTNEIPPYADFITICGEEINGVFYSEAINR